MFGRVGGRSRLAAVGAVVAVLVGGGGLLTASAAGSSQASSFVPITPCRLLDTRASDVVGPRSTPLGAGTTYTAAVWGSNGNCTIPAGATGLSMNVVAISPTAASFLTVFPADQPLPLASSLNWVGGQAPTPNAVTVSASADGKVSFYNQFGSVDLAVDIVGYYELSTSGPAGPQGEPGAPGTPGIKGDTGDPGPRPAQVVWVATSGGDFTSVSAALAAIGTTLPVATVNAPYVIKVAPGTYTEPDGIDMEDFVDLEGSGQTVTTILAASMAIQSSTVRATGTIRAEIRDLTIQNNGGGPEAIALNIVDTTSALRVTDTTLHAEGSPTAKGATISNASPAIAGVTALGHGDSGFAMGIEVIAGSAPSIVDTAARAIGEAGSQGHFGLRIDGASASTDNVIVDAQGSGSAHGLSLSGATGVLHNISARASFAAVDVFASAVTLEMLSTSASSVFGVEVVGPGSTVNIVGSQIRAALSSVAIGDEGSIVRVISSVLGTNESGAVACTFTADATGAPLNSTCD